MLFFILTQNGIGCTSLMIISDRVLGTGAAHPPVFSYVCDHG
jgi:hypothetical protein